MTRRYVNMVCFAIILSEKPTQNYHLTILAHCWMHFFFFFVVQFYCMCEQPLITPTVWFLPTDSL